MEILDRLETKIDGLLADITELKSENSRLQKDLAVLETLKLENQRLKEQLEKDQTDRSEIVNRIDTILKKLDVPEQSS